MKIINPYEIKKEDFPVFVFSDDLRGLFAWAIKSHTRGFYSHGMIMINPGKVATQGGTYKEHSIDIYMRGNHRLKFWIYTKLKPIDREHIIDKVEKDLEQSWWRRSYDYLGIIGQLFKISWFNNPYKSFCTERVASYLRLIPELKDKIPKHPSPAQLNKLFKNIPGMKVLGRCFED